MRKRIILIMLLLGNILAYSQNKKFPEVIPPAPNAISIAKFNQIPVERYTGTPSISIPIWNIEQGSLKLPITLDYHASGIKVAEIASCVGLGWSLKAGGSVTRSVFGLPDESSRGFLNSLYPWPEFEKTQYNTPYNFKIDPFFAIDTYNGVIDNQPDVFYYSIPSESGKFVLNKKGQIKLIPNKNIKITKGENITRLFDQNPLEGMSCDFISSWEIKSDGGVKYKFDAYEQTTSQMYICKQQGESHPESSTYSVNSWFLTEISTPQDTIKFTYENVVYSYDLPISNKQYIGENGGTLALKDQTKQRQYVSEKKLSTISFKNGEIHFISGKSQRADLIGQFPLEKIIIKNASGEIIKQYCLNYEYLIGANTVPFADVKIENETNYILNPSSLPLVGNRRLILKNVVETNASGIKKNNGFILNYYHDFGLPNRFSSKYDHWGYSNQPIESTNNPMFVMVGDPINQDYIITNKDPDIIYAKQGTLCKICYPTGGTRFFEYETHQAEKTSISPRIIEKNNGVSLTIGYGGKAYDLLEEPFEYKDGVKQYYSEFKINSLTNPVNIQIKLSGIPRINNNMYFYISNVNNLSSKIWYSGHDGSENFVSLNNGTYRLYHYPDSYLIRNSKDGILCNATILPFYQEVQHSNESTETISMHPIGGLRISQIKDYEQITQKLNIRKYDYKGGTITCVPNYVYDYVELTSNFGECHYKVCNISSNYPLSNTHGAPVGYKNISERTLDHNGNLIYLSEQEYTSPNYLEDNVELEDFPDYAFSTTIDKQSSTNLTGTFSKRYANQFKIEPPFAPIDNRDWLRGILLKSKEYKVINNKPFLVREENNTYSFKIEPVTRGYVGMWTKMAEDINQRNGIATMYDFSSGYYYPKHVEIKEYTPQGIITSSIDNIFSEKSLQIIKSSKKTSCGAIIHTFKMYPNEYLDNNDFIDKLKKRNIVNTPIEEITAVEGNKVTQIISGKLCKFQNNNLGLIDEILRLEFDSLVTLRNFKFSWNSFGNVNPFQSTSIFSPDKRYQTEIKFDCYDNSGNILQIHKNDNKNISFIWGYNNSLPVVQIENGTINLINNTLYSLISKHPFNNSIIYTEIKKDVDFLKNQMSFLFHNKKIKLSLYTYSPLVGMTSQTDSKGVTVYYEYDTFGRLKHILDSNGKITRKYEHNYYK